MRVYLASRYGRREELLGYAEDLKRLGHEVTSSWLYETPEEQAKNWRPDPLDFYRFAVTAVQDLARSDISIHFTEAPTQDMVSGELARGGRHTEFGLALAMGIKPVIVGPRENIFHYLKDVRVCASWPDALALLAPEVTP